MSYQTECPQWISSNESDAKWLVSIQESTAIELSTSIH
ncbi:hypothetical protein X975_11871, partial [Stegodyphus mimosarum]